MQPQTAAPILATKLFPPTPREGLVARPRLTALLNEGLSRPFTLISAPPGFGKTTLIGAWQSRAAGPASVSRTVAWLSLDGDDNDPLRFAGYVIAAVQSVQPDVGTTAADLLRSTQPPPPHVVLASFINDISTSPGTPALVLVLDDYHVIASRAVHDATTFLIERLPSHMHIFMTTRADPPFALARWRSRGQMVEIRQEDLRFTADEVAALVRHTSRLAFSAQDVAALEARTEGWVVALQLAALAARNHPDAAHFLAAFTGEHRYLMDYLTDEVIEQQPRRVRAFLLATSVLERMCAELCAAVVSDALGEADDGGPTQSQALLEYLERANLFIIPLDDRRQWYRYHHLFAEVLRNRLRHDHSGRSDTLHQRASAWFESNGLAEEAIHHAMAGNDFGAAARLIETHAEAMLWRGAQSALETFMNALPPETRAGRPRLLTYAALFHAGRQRFDFAERDLGAAEKTEAYANSSNGERLSLRAEADTVRTMILLSQSKFAETIEVGRRALQHLPTTAARQRAFVLQRMGTASDWLGDLQTGSKYYHEARQIALRGNDVPSVFRCDLNLISMESTPRNVQQTRDRLITLRTFAKQHGLGESTNDGFVLRMLAEAEYVLNNLDASDACAQHALAIAVRDSMPNLEAISRCACAEVLAAQGKLDDASSQAQRALDLTVQFQMAARYTAVVRAVCLEIWLRSDQADVAAAWIQAHPLSLNDYLSVRAVEYLAYARVSAALGDFDTACQIVACALGESRRQKNEGQEFLALLLQSSVAHHMGQAQLSRAALEAALAIGQAQRLIRPFLNEGPVMAAALEDWRVICESNEVGEDSTLIAYADALLAAFAPPTPAAGATHVEIAGGLSEREFEILRLMCAGLSNQDIAGTLFVAVGTVKKHLYNVYGKLGVSSRTQAIARAREMGLV